MTIALLVGMALMALADGAVWEAVGILLLVWVLVAFPRRRGGRWWLIRL